MPVNATLTSTPTVSGTTTSPSTVSASTQSGSPVPQITRMAIEGIRGADGDMTWAGQWSSSTNYVANQVVEYNGSAYVCIQGNSNMAPSSNATQWTLMVSKGDTGSQGIQGVAGATGAKGAVGDTGAQGATGPTGSTGSQGPQGATGATGSSGNAATISVGSTTTGSAGSSATVANSGSSSAAVLDFTIPRGNTGATGATGANGAAATLSIGTVSTGLPGSSASVTNTGSNTAATLNITIPRGDTGADGDLTWKGGWSSSTAYSTNEAVQYNGSSYIAVANNQNVTPTSDTSKWNLMAQAGAEGGSIGSMEDTVISSSVPEMSVLAYDNGATKWKDKSIFTGTFASPQLDGGVF